MKRERQAVILLVEPNTDDAFICRTRARMEKLDADFRVVESAEAAMKWLEAQPPYASRDLFPMPDLIITDYSMPKINGLELIHWLRSHSDLPRIPVLVHTSSLGPQDELDAIKLGGNVFIEKTANCAPLTAALKAFLQEFYEPMAATR